MTANWPDSHTLAKCRKTGLPFYNQAEPEAGILAGYYVFDHPHDPTPRGPYPSPVEAMAENAVGDRFGDGSLGLEQTALASAPKARSYF